MTGRLLFNFIQMHFWISQNSAKFFIFHSPAFQDTSCNSTFHFHIPFRLDSKIVAFQNNNTGDYKINYCNSLFLNLNCQQTNRLQLILRYSTDYNLTLLLVLSLKHLNTIISLLISNLSTGSKSHNAYNTKLSLAHTSHCNSNSHLLF